MFKVTFQKNSWLPTLGLYFKDKLWVYDFSRAHGIC